MTIRIQWRTAFGALGLLALGVALVWRSAAPVSAPATSASDEEALAESALAPYAASGSADNTSFERAITPSSDSPRIAGTVRYMKTGEPAPGVRVLASEHSGNSEVHAFTDAQGFYVLASLKPTEYLVTVRSPREGHVMLEAPGYADRYGMEHFQPIRLSEGETRSGVNITLASGGAVSGKVIDKSISYDTAKLPALLRDLRGDNMEAAFREFMREADRPISGVRIRLMEAGDTATNGCIQEATTDENGRYVLTDCPAGKCAIVAEPPAGAVIADERDSSRYRVVDIPPTKDVNDVDFSFRLDSVVVIGRVSDRAGRAIPTAKLQAEMPERRDQDGSESGGEARTSGIVRVLANGNEDGFYRLCGLAPAHILHAHAFVWWAREDEGLQFAYTLRAFAPGYATADVSVPPVPDSLDKVTKTLRDEVIRSHQGQIAAGKIPNMSYRPLLSGPDDAILVNISLEREATVSGRLVDARDRPLAKASIRMTDAEPSKERLTLLTTRRVIPESVTTDETGAFEIAKIPEGDYVFDAIIEGVGRLRARNAPLKLRPGDAVRDLELLVEAREDRGDLAGTVLDASSGAAVTQFSVSVDRVDSPQEPHPRHGDVSTEKDKNTFTIRGVSPGDAMLHISAAGYPPTEVRAQVESGKVANVSVRLTPEGVVEGVVTVNGVPASGRVSVRSADGDPIGENWERNQSFVTIPCRSVDIGADGAFTIRELPPGDYLIRADAVVAPGPPASYRYNWTRASVAAGRVTHHDLDVQGTAALRGSFVFPDSYKYGWIHVYEGRAPGLSPSVDEPAAWRLVRATVDTAGESGAYEITNLVPGDYTVIAFCFGHRDKTGPAYEQDRHQVSHVITVDGDDVELDLEIEPPP